MRRESIFCLKHFPTSAWVKAERKIASMNDLYAIIIIHEAIHAGKMYRKIPSDNRIGASCRLGHPAACFPLKATPQGLMSIRKSTTTFITLSLIIRHLIKIILQEVPHEKSNTKRLLTNGCFLGPRQSRFELTKQNFEILRNPALRTIAQDIQTCEWIVQLIAIFLNVKFYNTKRWVVPTKFSFIILAAIV